MHQTHQLRGSRYPLEHVTGALYRDEHGNTMYIGKSNVEEVDRPEEPEDNTLWRQPDGALLVYSTRHQNFFGETIWSLKEYQMGHVHLTKVNVE